MDTVYHRAAEIFLQYEITLSVILRSPCCFLPSGEFPKIEEYCIIQHSFSFLQN